MSGGGGDFSLLDLPVSAKLPEAAEILRMSERKVWGMGKRGDILRIEEHGSVRYDVRGYIERKRSQKGEVDGNGNQ